MRRIIALAALGLAAAPAFAKDYLVTTARPDSLYVFDAAERKLARECKLDVHIMPSVITMSPDGKIAYMLVNRWQDVVGIDVTNCEKVFFARQSDGDVVSRSIGSIAVSQDGTEVYTVRNPVRHLIDRYEVMEPEFTVYDSSAGLDAKPKATFPAPRRSTVMATDRNGAAYIAGHDIYRVDPQTGETEVAIANATWDRPTYSPPDVLAFWPVGTQNHEFLLMYSAAKFTDAKQEEIADFVWGYSTVNLDTGETDIRDFASFDVLMFSAVRNPKAPNELYGVYTQLSKHDVETKELIKRVDLPHTYYCINISADGKEVYVGGTNDDIGVYSTETLEKIGEMRIPSGGDMGVATLQITQLD